MKAKNYYHFNFMVNLIKLLVLIGIFVILIYYCNAFVSQECNNQTEDIDNQIRDFAWCLHDAESRISHGMYANKEDCKNFLKDKCAE